MTNNTKELLERADEALTLLVGPWEADAVDKSRTAAHKSIKELISHIASMGDGWLSIEEYKKPTKEESDGEKVLLGHWADYGKEQDYFGPNCWLWITSGSLGYDIKGELKIWIDKDDDFMPFTNDFYKVTHFKKLPQPPENS